jgi:hypothetical protein
MPTEKANFSEKLSDKQNAPDCKMQSGAKEA